MTATADAAPGAVTGTGDTPPDPPERPRRHRAITAVRFLLALGVMVALFGFAIPRLTGAGYGEVWDRLRSLSVLELGLLAAVWAAGIVSYAFALRTCLRGLTVLQGVVINTAGSAVSNLFPFGGVAGVGSTYGMARSWGHRASAVSATILATGLFNFFATLLLPTLGLALLTVVGRASWQLALFAVVGVVITGLGIGFLTVIERSESATVRLGQRFDRVLARLTRLVRLRRQITVSDGLLEFRAGTSTIVRDRWRPLALSVAFYRLLQFLLLLLCIRFIDPATALGPIEVFAAYAFGRTLTTVPVTPAGAGVVETGTIAALVSLGGASVPTTAAVLLFSTFVFLLELPVGGMGWLLWATKRSWRRVPPA